MTSRVEVKRANDGIPAIEFPWPPCPICDGGLEHDGDSWDCYRCKLGWDRTGMYGQWRSDTEPCGDARDIILYPESQTIGQLTKYAVCHLDEGHLDRDAPLPHAGYDPAEVTKYSGPTDWIRWDADGKRVW